MKKNTLAILAISVICLTGAGLSIPYFAKKSLLQRVQPLQALSGSTSSLAQQSAISSSLFSTQIAFTSADPKITKYLADSLVLNATIEHPVGTWFSEAPLPIQGTATLQGNVFEHLFPESRLETLELPFNGALEKSGNLILEVSMPESTFNIKLDESKKETLSNIIKTAKWNIKVSPLDDVLSAQGNYPLMEQHLMDSKGVTQHVSSVINTKVDFTQRISDNIQGSIKTHTQKMEFPLLSAQMGGAPAYIEGVKTGSIIALKQKEGHSFYDFDMYFHMDKTSPIPIVNSLGMQLDLSVRQIDAQLLRNLIGQMEKAWDSDNQNTPMDDKALRAYFDQFALKGIAFNLDRFKVSDQSNNAVQAAALMAIAPVSDRTKLSLEDNLSLQLILNAQGPLLQLIESNVSQLSVLGINNIQIVRKSGIPTLDVALLLNKYQLLVNKMPVGDALMQSMHAPWVQSLRKADTQLGWQQRPLIEIQVPEPAIAEPSSSVPVAPNLN